MIRSIDTRSTESRAWQRCRRSSTRRSVPRSSLVGPGASSSAQASERTRPVDTSAWALATIGNHQERWSIDRSHHFSIGSTRWHALAAGVVAQCGPAGGRQALVTFVGDFSRLGLNSAETWRGRCPWTWPKLGLEIRRIGASGTAEFSSRNRARGLGPCGHWGLLDAANSHRRPPSR